MLSRIQVRNYVLIDSLEIDFPEGLIIITGQTGAGKSILLGALSLLMGAKADASMVGSNADNCVVEAEFETSSDDASLNAVLEENDVDQDEGHLIIRRVLNRSGRSRAFINDCPVSIQVLASISTRLIDIHSQHQTQMLSDRRIQMDILDHYAGNMHLRAECASCHRSLSSLKAELAVVEAEIAQAQSQRDYNETQFSQLEAASLKEGELEELEQEQKQLANAEEIKMNLAAAENIFAGDSISDIMSVDASLKEVARCLEKAGKYIPASSELAQRVDSCRHELDDIYSEVVSANSRIELSQNRLDEVETRMSLLYSLMQKHGCRNEEELIAIREKLSETLFDSTRLEERRGTLVKEIEEISQNLKDLSDRLHESRMASVTSFSETVRDSIRSLELPYAVFEVALTPVEINATGSDAVSYMFNSSGGAVVEVAKCASGGEMSRLMLALKNMMARYTNMPTMIFDEIDTGVSGSVADKMGTMICEMGKNMQVFAITHLPQVAAKGNAHYLVSKEIDPDTNHAVTSIARLSENDRVMEVARMLSGSVLTEAAVANAETLLGLRLL